MTISFFPLLANPPAGSIILTRPASELYSCLSRKQLPSLELVIRAIKVLALALFRGHLYDQVALSTANGILQSFNGKVQVLTCEELQRKYPDMLENAHVLIFKETNLLPANFARQTHFPHTVEASTLGQYFFNDAHYTIKDFIKSENFSHEALIQRVPTDNDKKRNLNFILKEGRPEELIEFKNTCPDVYCACRDKADDTPFEVAARHKNIKIARYLARTEQNINDVNDFKISTLLQKALALGDLETIQILLERNAAKNALDRRGNNMMHYAALSGNIEVVRLVSGWDYLAGYEKGCSHISIPEAFWAAQSGNLDCLKYMLNNPPNPLPLQTPRPRSPWDNEHSWMYETNNDLNPLKHESVRGTILHYAVEGGHLPTVQYLIEQGTNPLKSNSTYEYPIHIAAAQGNIQIVKYLWPLCQARGMQIDEKSNNGSLLYRAVNKANSLELVKYLIEQGASLRCRNCFWKNVLDLVNKPGYPNPEIKNYILGLA